MQVLALHTSASSYSQYRILGYLILGIGLLVSCEPEQVTENKLRGKWSIIKASRNNKLTSTLEDGFFNFTSDSTFLTNIYNSDEVYRYRITEDGFDQYIPNDQSYRVEYGGRDTIQINTRILKYDFQFLATKDTVTTATLEL